MVEVHLDRSRPVEGRVEPAGPRPRTAHELSLPRPGLETTRLAPRNSVARPRWLATLVAASCALAGTFPSPSPLLAQGVTTAAIAGAVHAPDGFEVDGAHVTVTNTANGFVVRSEVRHGRFEVSSLEVGGPYLVTLSRIGFHPQQRAGIVLALGERHELRFVMLPVAVALDTLLVAGAAFPRVNASGGTGTIVPQALLHRLPTLNRNVYDFVRLAPQISTKVGFAAGGMSAGGAGFRFNSFLVNGVPQQSVAGQVPPEFSGAKTVPFDAVSEYQILLAPFDVRYGGFAGALVNAVTRSGTNRFRGSVFAYGRSDALDWRAREADRIPYERLQYGFSAGGPILRDRLHFFVASDLEHFNSLAPGPYAGQPSTAAEPVPVSSSDLARVQEILRGHGLTAGSAGPVENANPSRSVFARLDLSLPRLNTRAVTWVTDTRSRDLDFSRGREVFPLTTHTATLGTSVRNASVQLHTALPRAGGGHNELLISHRSAETASRPAVRQPIVRVAVPATTAGAVTLVTGTPQQAQGSSAGSTSIKLKDDLTLPLGGSHVALLGVEAERFRGDRSGVLNAYGTWTFASLDSLALGVAESYTVERDFGTAGVPIDGGQYALYAGDRWQVRDRVSVTVGIRAEVLAIDGRAPYNPAVDSSFARRTDEMPPARVHLSPRLGFTWDLFGTGLDQLRGGVGVFTGRPPLGWLHAALYGYGIGIGSLRCGRLPADLGPPPPFAASSHLAPPQECANGVGLTSAPRGNVELLEERLGLARALRGALAYDRRLPWDLTGTVEALVTRHLADFVFVNLNLAGPQSVDRRGRVLYGTIGPTGLAAPTRRSSFSEVTELRNSSQTRAYQLSARLEKRFGGGTGATGHYTFSRVRDAQTPLRVNVPGSVNWSSRAVSGLHDPPNARISLNDVPHRIVLAGTQRAPWRTWSTEISFHYVGESGGPFTYLA